MQDEKALVEQAQAGNSTAFATLYEGYFDKIYRYLLLRVGSKTEAEDLTGQVFLKALEALPSFRWRGAPFASWLFRIAHNQVVDHWRKASKRTTLPLDNSIIGGEVDPAAIVEQKLRIEELVASVRDLTEAQRQVIALRFAAGLSIAEVAKAMGKKEGAVKALQHSALRALRRILLWSEGDG